MMAQFEERCCGPKHIERVSVSVKQKNATFGVYPLALSEKYQK